MIDGIDYFPERDKLKKKRIGQDWKEFKKLKKSLDTDKKTGKRTETPASPETLKK